MSIAEVQDRVHAAEVLAKVAWGDEPAVVVGESIVGIWAGRAQDDVSLLLAVRSFDARAEHRGEGHASVVGWLQHHCRMPKRMARRLARLARFLARLPQAEEVLRAGDLGLEHLEVLADAHTERTHEAWVEAAPLLLAFAAEARFEDFAREVRRFADRLCPQDADDRFEDQLADRHVTTSTSIDGFGFVQAWMDPLSYAIFKDELDRRYQELFEEDWVAAREVLGRDPDGVELRDLTRTHEQRMHDALVRMAERSKTLAGGTVAAAASVVIHCDEGSFEAALARFLGDDTVEYPPDGFCETQDGAVISPLAAVHAALLGRVRGIIFDTDGTILHWGRSRRLFTPAQAAALRAKYRRCTHPYGCDLTGSRLQSDHHVEHQDGGRTDIDNGMPKCPHHNRWKTNQRGQPPPPGRRDHDQRRAPPDLGLP